MKSLEEKTKKCSEEPAAKRPRLASSYDDSSSSDEISSVSTDRSLPDIEVRASDGNILIRIYCKKQNGIMKEIFNELDKLNLSIISCSVMPFGYNTSHITVITQVLIKQLSYLCIWKKKINLIIFLILIFCPLNFDRWIINWQVWHQIMLQIEYVRLWWKKKPAHLQHNREED